MTQDITIPFGGILQKTDQPIYYRACSAKLAWRKLAKSGSASHGNLDSAVYGNKGAVELFGNSSFAHKRRTRYGTPIFVAVWLEDYQWALLIKERVAAIVPQIRLAHLENIQKEDAELLETIERVSKQLTYLHDNASSHILLDKQDKLTTWSGKIAVRNPVDTDDNTISRASGVLENIAEDLEVEGAFTFENLEDAREKVLAQVVRRRGQPAFRKALLEAYEGRCAISRCDVSAVLEAAHIHPYLGERTNYVTNGILLRADLHTLFDLGLLIIDSDAMNARLAKSLRDSAYGPLHGVKIHVPDSEKQRPIRDALDWHRSQYSANGGGFWVEN